MPSSSNAPVPPHAAGQATPPTGIAIVGCGYVADFYLTTLPNYPNLVRVGCYDRDANRATTIATRYRLHNYPTLDALLADDRVELVLNLTNPGSHYEVTRRCLLAGKHVYSEKPFAETIDQATELVELADRLGLAFGSAPCSLLGEAAQTLWHALRDNVIGRPRLVYADLDDGAIHHMPYHTWISPSGVSWPVRDEFAVGATMEHAAYYLSWLTAFFGPVREVTGFAARLTPDKLEGLAPEAIGADFSCACLRFSSGVVARLTCGTVAPENRSLRIVGDRGVLSMDEIWDFSAPVTLRRLDPATTGHRYLAAPEIYPAVRPADYAYRYDDLTDMDYARGVADLAAAIHKTGEACLTARHSLHVLDVVLAINDSVDRPGSVRITSDFDPIEPARWAIGGIPR